MDLGYIDSLFFRLPWACWGVSILEGCQQDIGCLGVSGGCRNLIEMVDRETAKGIVHNAASRRKLLRPGIDCVPCDIFPCRNAMDLLPLDLSAHDLGKRRPVTSTPCVSFLPQT